MGCEYSRKFGIPYSKYFYIIFASENIRDTSKSTRTSTCTSSWSTCSNLLVDFLFYYSFGRDQLFTYFIGCTLEFFRAKPLKQCYTLIRETYESQSCKTHFCKTICRPQGRWNYKSRFEMVFVERICRPSRTGLSRNIVRYLIKYQSHSYWPIIKAS